MNNVHTSAFTVKGKHSLVKFIICASLILFAGKNLAIETNPCAHETDNSKRLACYDQIFSKKSVPVQKTETAAISAQEARIRQENLPAERSSSNLSKFWELDPQDKKESFVVKTYLPNFLLPIHHTSSINNSPSSPTHAAGTKYKNLRQNEAKLQISLRAKIADELFIPGANLWFAYTQQSLWQVWDSDDSSPFRSTDYQPEAIYNIPVPAKLGELPYGWRWRLLQLGIAHQSNGQSDPFSRSWNRIYAGAAFERDNLSLSYRYHYRLGEKSNEDDNPDLTDYIGKNEFSLNWLPGKSTVSLTWKSTPKNLSRGSTQLDFTYPVFSNNPNGLRWYLQLFSGYGETLLDYNHRQNRIGAGLTLFQF